MFWSSAGWRFGMWTIVVLAAMNLTGCSKTVKLNPHDLVSYVAADLKAPREDITVSTNFRTAIVLEVQRMNIEEAHAAMEKFIASCLGYFQRDQVNDFLNDTVVFVLQKQIDRSQQLRWSAIKEDVRDWVTGTMPQDRFLERLTREEQWSLELE